MQIQAISIDHLLSFDEFVWQELDPHLNVIVGPNGVGKTNLFHAFRLVRDVLNPTRSQDAERWVGASHQGSGADTIIIKLDIQFTTTWEKHLLCVFFASMLCDQQDIQQMATTMQRSVNHDGLKKFDRWVLEHIRPEDISWFLQGRLVITHTGRLGWQCWYEARPQEPIFRLNLTNWEMLLGHDKHNAETAGQNWGSLFVAWYNSLTEQERDQLKNGLTETTPEREFPVPDLSHLPDWVSSQQGIPLQIRDQTQIVDPTTLATRRALASAAGISLEQEKPFGMRSVFQILLERAFVFTDNVRLMPQRLFAADHLFAQPFDLSNGEQLARFLFCKKNGDLRDREHYDEIGKLFTQMTGRTFHVVIGSVNVERSQTRLPGSQQQARLLSDQQANLSLELVTSSSWGDIPLDASGAGIAEALFLSAVLTGGAGLVVLLDEPALNLHPPMQTTLLHALEALAHQPEGKRSQLLVNTHAPNLVPSDMIECISRFTLQNGHTTRHAFNAEQMHQSGHKASNQSSRNDLIKLRNLLRGNMAARALLFSRAVLLVEGETELGALPVWCQNLVSQDIALYVVGGKGEFVSPLRLLHHFAIPWAILGDGEVLWDQHEQGSRQGALGQVSRILAACNRTLPIISNRPETSAENFAEFRQALESYGIFTLARSADEGFEKAIRPEIPQGLWSEAELRFSQNKVAFGRFIAESIPCPENVAGLVQKVLCHWQKQDADIYVPDNNCSQLPITHSGSSNIAIILENQ